MSARFIVPFLISTCAFAQAWVSPQGTTSILVGIQHTQIDSHTLFDGRKVFDVDVRADTLALAIDYSLTDRVALAVSLPYVRSQYRGTKPHPGIVDDGGVHGTLQDLRIDLRYMAFEDPVVVTPTLSWLQPSRDYPAIGHAAAGRGLEELEVGVFLSSEVPSIPGLFVGGRGAYTFVEKVDPDINVDRTNAELQVGYPVARRMFVRAFGSWVDTREGLTLPLSAQDRQHHSHHHDQMLKSNFVRAGAALSFSVTNAVEVFLTYGENIRSENAHAGQTIGLGTVWTFSPRTLLARRNEARAAARQLASRADGF